MFELVALGLAAIMANSILFFLVVGAFVVVVWSDWAFEGDSEGGIGVVASVALLVVLGFSFWLGYLGWWVVPWAVAYVVAGAVFALLKWTMVFVPGARKAFDQTDLGDSLPEKYWTQRTKTSKAWTAFKQSKYDKNSPKEETYAQFLERKPEYKSEQVDPREYAPTADQHRSRIASWVAWWPPHAAWFLLKEPAKWVVDVMKGAFNAISRRAFS